MIWKFRKKLYKNVYKTLIIILNVSIFLLNLIYLIFIRVEFINNINLFFKNSDSFNFNISNKNYSDISIYLNNKFISDNQKKFENITTTKKTVKVLQIGTFNKTWNRIWLQSKLDDEFIIEFNETDPDYLIYNVYDIHKDNDMDLNIKFQNCIKIAFYTENIMIDMNYADYIIGIYHINYLDRYFKHSTSFLWQNFSSLDIIRREVLHKPIRTNFCAAVISNCGKFYNYRLKIIDKLNKYKKVDMGGHCRNNINKGVINKINFLSSYKFSIAMENSNGDGYASEKIIDSFLAGTIPIYYGDYMIDEFINPKTYILIKGDSDMDEKIEYIKQIDNDINLYKSIMKENPILDNNFANILILN